MVDAAAREPPVRPGANEHDAAYFREAASGKPDSKTGNKTDGKFVFDPQSGARDYYASYPIRAGDTQHRARDNLRPRLSGSSLP